MLSEIITPTKKQVIAKRLSIPENIQVILWDMDGVLIDSLSLSLIVCNKILSKQFGEHVKLSGTFIRSIFAYDIPEFWRLILMHAIKTHQIPDDLSIQQTLIDAYHKARDESSFKLNEGIFEILEEAKSQSLKMVVVSNNPTEEVKDTLNQSGILGYFDEVIGNDIENLNKKPSPDSYLFAAKMLGVAPEHCVVIEDSLIGIEAGNNAGCFTVAVATGGIDYEVLAQTQWADQTYSSFKPQALDLQFGDVRKKNIITPNDFVSHMIEHIAWRLCVEIQLNWSDNDWFELGCFVGEKIGQQEVYQNSAAALGMIDDGSAEVIVDLSSDKSGLTLTGIDVLDLEWFLSLRCEQLPSGMPLVELMEGLSQGLKADIQVKICSVQDAHHTWEGVFRSIGISLNKIFTPKYPATLDLNYPVEKNNNADGELRVLEKSLHYCKVMRGTAESHVVVSVDFSQQLENNFVFNVAPNIDVTELPLLLEHLSKHAEFTLQVEYNATVLNSSHVVLEDTALVLGKALLEIIMLRMIHWGVNGAGSSIQSIDDINSQPIHTGLSIEGRKFWIFVPFKDSSDTLRKNFLMGQNIYTQLRSEDLDDFLDGLSGGLGCSIIVHVHEIIEADKGWQLIFANLGTSLKEAFAYNPYRKGVPPGVKATLA